MWKQWYLHIIVFFINWLNFLVKGSSWYVIKIDIYIQIYVPVCISWSIIWICIYHFYRVCNLFPSYLYGIFGGLLSYGIMYCWSLLSFPLLLSVCAFEGVEDFIPPGEVWAVICLKIMQFIFKVDFKCSDLLCFEFYFVLNRTRFGTCAQTDKTGSIWYLLCLIS